MAVNGIRENDVSRSRSTVAAVTGALRRDPAIMLSRSLVLFAAIDGDHLRGDQQRTTSDADLIETIDQMCHGQPSHDHPCGHGFIASEYGGVQTARSAPWCARRPRPAPPA